MGLLVLQPLETKKVSFKKYFTLLSSLSVSLRATFCYSVAAPHSAACGSIKIRLYQCFLVLPCCVTVDVPRMGSVITVIWRLNGRQLADVDPHA